jgi:protein-glucosylgalactosylhydroxylysine glucosidase
MIRKIFILLFLLTSVFNLVYSQAIVPKIDREALVKRHNVFITSFDSLSSLSVGNGEFAFTVDATGLQTFPDKYKNGIPLGTQSTWAWHSFANPQGYKFEETYKYYDFNGKKAPYTVQSNEPGRNKEAADWYRKNPHRLHLGNIGFEITKKDGSVIKPSDIKGIKQELDLWTGIINSHFEVEGIPVDVITYCANKNDINNRMDMVTIQVKSELFKRKQLKIKFSFPYPSGGHSDDGCDWKSPGKHQTVPIWQDKRLIFQRVIDETEYFLVVEGLNTNFTMQEIDKQHFAIEPKAKDNTFEVSFLFDKGRYPGKFLPFAAQKLACETYWKTFWNRGGAIDFSGSTDPRASELERRVILSQYLTAIQCSGSYPPQETGLTYNSWYGKFHLEMHWWHGAHFALWNRLDLLEKSLNWYNLNLKKAQAIAERQGYKGARWMKMTDPSANEAPSSVGSFLIWQQPHIIYFAELCYRGYKVQGPQLEKYKNLVFATADFMASFPVYDKEKDRYVLKGIIAAQERFKPENAFNTPFEIAYWHWALNIAQEWRVRLKMPKNPEWQKVIDKLSRLAEANGLYLAAESAPDSYTTREYMTDHPAVLGAYGMLPGSGLVNPEIMKNTFNTIWEKWNWEETWGWDFPFTAMTATRLGLPDKAIDALFMQSKSNTYLINGHNYQDDRLRLYLPGNGGLLSAVAMMVAGYDGCTTDMPGIPKDGKWKVKWENIAKMP